MASPGVFAKRMRQLAHRVEVEAGNAAVKTALVINQIVILATPVDTGRARANWQVGLGGPITEEIMEEDKTGAATISRNNSRLAVRRPRQIIFLSNNVDYINELNRGSSSQAPANFVELAVAAGAAFLKRKRLLR